MKILEKGHRPNKYAAEQRYKKDSIVESGIYPLGIETYQRTRQIEYF